jgi:hypothetical protein
VYFSNVAKVNYLMHIADFLKMNIIIEANMPTGQVNNISITKVNNLK